MFWSLCAHWCNNATVGHPCYHGERESPFLPGRTMLPLLLTNGKQYRIADHQGSVHYYAILPEFILGVRTVLLLLANKKPSFDIQGVAILMHNCVTLLHLKVAEGLFLASKEQYLTMKEVSKLCITALLCLFSVLFFFCIEKEYIKTLLFTDWFCNSIFHILKCNFDYKQEI